jgi:hypothetical protein
MISDKGLRVPSPTGGFASKVKVERKIDDFIAQKGNKAHAKPTFEAKPPQGEGV